jgi:hypothetical protein
MPASAERAAWTVHAARLLANEADAIAAACAQAKPSEIVVALIEPTLTFGGAWIIPRSNLVTWVSRLERGTYSLTFAPNTSRQEVQARAATWGNLAGRRLALLQRRER